MNLNESIVEDAALEWLLLRQGYGRQGYAVGQLLSVTYQFDLQGG